MGPAMKGKKRHSRWGGARYFADKMVDALYWFKGKRGWRLIEEQMNEIEFCNTFAHEKAGFFRGARVRRN